jgi:hypothetical protein
MERCSKEGNTASKPIGTSFPKLPPHLTNPSEICAIQSLECPNKHLKDSTTGHAFIESFLAWHSCHRPSRIFQAGCAFKAQTDWTQHAPTCDEGTFCNSQKDNMRPFCATFKGAILSNRLKRPCAMQFIWFRILVVSCAMVIVDMLFCCVCPFLCCRNAKKSTS